MAPHKGTWRVEQESRPCRRCGATTGQTCVTSNGNIRRGLHAERWNDAMEARGEPFKRRPEGRLGRRHFDGSMTHGTQFAYIRRKCRCAECRAWAAARHQKYFAAHPDKAAESSRKLIELKLADPERDREIQARCKERERERNAELAQKAIEGGRHWQRWTGPDLEMAARTDLTAAQIGAMIGRSAKSVACMRSALNSKNPRDRMLANGPAPPTSRSGPR